MACITCLESGQCWGFEGSKRTKCLTEKKRVALSGLPPLFTKLSAYMLWISGFVGYFFALSVFASSVVFTQPSLPWVQRDIFFRQQSDQNTSSHSPSSSALNSNIICRLPHSFGRRLFFSFTIAFCY